MLRAFLFLIVFAFGAILWSQFGKQTTAPPPVNLTIPNNIDYYLEQTRQRSFNADGSIDFILISELLEHYELEDKSAMQQPDLLLQRKTSWRITSALGDLFHPEELMVFTQDVRLNKQSTLNPFNVWSNNILFNMKQDLVISETDVKVKADTWHFDAQSMTLNLKDDIHQFTTIKAHYRNDKKT